MLLASVFIIGRHKSGTGDGGNKRKVLCGCRGHGVTCKSFPPAEWVLSDGPDTATTGDGRLPDPSPLGVCRIFMCAQIHNRAYMCVSVSRR